MPPAGIEPATYGLGNLVSPAITTDPATTSNNPEIVLASCLALLRQKSADLALLVERWDALPEAVRAGIAAMVRATKKA